MGSSRVRKITQSVQKLGQLHEESLHSHRSQTRANEHSNIQKRGDYNYKEARYGLVCYISCEFEEEQ